MTVPTPLHDKHTMGAPATNYQASIFLSRKKPIFVLKRQQSFGRLIRAEDLHKQHDHYPRFLQFQQVSEVGAIFMLRIVRSTMVILLGFSVFLQLQKELISTGEILQLD